VAVAQAVLAPVAVAQAAADQVDAAAGASRRATR
jgi:hypothetical protein